MRQEPRTFLVWAFWQVPLNFYRLRPQQAHVFHEQASYTGVWQ